MIKKERIQEQFKAKLILKKGFSVLSSLVLSVGFISLMSESLLNEPKLTGNIAIHDNNNNTKKTK